MINAEELFHLLKLGKDDTFAFGCNMCGKCCREREDILLTPLDLFKIAKYLNRALQGVISEYCEFYEGRDSKIPVVRISPVSIVVPIRSQRGSASSTPSSPWFARCILLDV